MPLTLAPENIHQLAQERFRQHSDAFGQSKSYISHNVENVCKGSGWRGLAYLALLQHRTDSDALMDNAIAGTRLLETVSEKMGTCYRIYHDTDDAGAVRFTEMFSQLGQEATYTNAPHLGSTAGAAPFSPEVATLRSPTPIEGIPEETWMAITLFGDFLSPSYYLMKICELTIGCNPIDQASEWLIGDYRSISIAGDAISALAEFSSRTAQLISADANNLFSGWMGEAADAAQPYFQEFLHLFAAQAGPLSELGALYTQLAWAAWEGAKAVASAIGALLDWIITKAVELIGGLLGAETGPGDIAIVGILELWSDVVTIHGYVVAACFGLVAIMSATNVAFTHVSLATFKEG